MNGRLTLRGLVGTFVFLSWFGCSGALALSVELANDEVYQNDELPPSVVKAINVPKRVYAFLRGGGEAYVKFEHEFYFKGDTRQLNAMLEAMAPLVKVKESQLTAKIIPGPGRDSKWSGLGSEEKEFVFNWSVRIAQTIVYGTVAKEGGQTKDGREITSFELKETGTAWRVGVEIHVDGDIDLGHLRLPLAYEVSAGGRIADFVELHKSRRQKDPGGRVECHTTPTEEIDPNKRAGSGIFEDDRPRFEPAQDLPTALAQLVKLDPVQPVWINAFGWESPYYKLKPVFLAKGDDEYFQKMLNSDNVVVRAMGTDCILESQGAKAIGILKTRLSSRAVLQREYGILEKAVTEGGFARHLVMNALAGQKAPTTQKGFDDRPHLLSDQDRFALDIDILSRNDMAAMHEDAAAEIAMFVDANHIPRFIRFSNQGVMTFNLKAITFLAPLDLPSLRKQTGGQSDAAIIKAIGRVRPNSDVEGFLVKCLNNTGLDARSRLAAASALTRYTDDQAREAIESNKDSLNRLQADAGTRIWNSFLIRERYEKDIAPIRQDETAAGWLRLEDSIRSVVQSYDHPMVWDDFRNFIGMFKTTAAQALLKVSNRLTTEIEPWNTYGGIPYLCEFALNSEDLLETEAKREGRDPSELTFKRLLSAEEYQRLVHNIEAAIGAESKAATQPTAAK